MNLIDTSAIDMVEVSAATVSSRKNSADHSRVPGICENTSGRVTNTNVGPSSEWAAETESGHGRENYDSHHHCHQHVEERHRHGCAGQSGVARIVGGVGDEYAHAEAEREKCLAEGVEPYRRRDLGEVGTQEEFQSGSGLGERQRHAAEYHKKQEQQGHEHVAETLDAFAHTAYEHG